MYADLGDLEAGENGLYRSDGLGNRAYDPALSGLELALMKTAYAQLITRGAVVSSNLHGAVTHVVVSRCAPDLKDRLVKVQVGFSRC
jgi:hypothetical protein